MQHGTGDEADVREGQQADPVVEERETHDLERLHEYVRDDEGVVERGCAGVSA